MIMHVYVGGRERIRVPVPAGKVQKVLDEVDARMPALLQQGRLCVTLDSDVHSNVTYILNPKQVERRR